MTNQFQQRHNGSVEMSLVRSVDRATKAFFIDDAGKISKDAEPPLYAGTAERVFVRDPEHLADILVRTPTNVVYIPGQMQRLGQSHPLGTKQQASVDPDLVARTKEHFGYQPGKPAVLLLDLDMASWPPDLFIEVQDAGGVHTVLSNIIAGLDEAARVWRPSVSSGVRNMASGEETGVRGLHLWVFVRDGGDARRVVEVLHQRLLLAGYGFAFESKAGAVLVRSIVDKSASGDGSRLTYEADAELLHPDLRHQPGLRKPEFRNGIVLDTTALHDLTPAEIDEVRAVERELRVSIKPDLASSTMPQSTSEFDGRTPSGRVARTISGSQQILLDDGRVIRAIDIILDPRKFHKATCADPDEPDYGGGKNKAVIYTDNNCPVRIHSQAHGGITYEIALTAQEVLAAVKGGASV